MKSTLLVTLATTLLLSTAPVSAPVQATTAILRCQSADGTLVYTDQACSAFGAKAVPMSGELMTRIVHEEALAAREAMQAGAPTEVGSLDVGSAGIPQDPAIAAPRRAATGGCARSPTQLAMDVRGSLTLGDVNRVAESYYWVGMSTRQGERTLDRLQHLLGRPVMDTHYFDAQVNLSPLSGGMPDAGATVASTDTRIGGEAGVLQLMLGGNLASAAAAPSVLNFEVKKYAGCYFIQF